MKKNVFISTMGCSKNLVDSEMMLSILKKHDIAKTESIEEADIAIVNTCGFIESAKEESINEILNIAEYKKTGNLKYLIVTGCLSQRYYEQLKEELPEVDAFLGTTSFELIYQTIDALEHGKAESVIYDTSYKIQMNSERELLTESYTAFIKIAEGCDNFCTYCIIPKLRGNYRSRKIEDVIKEAESLAKQGVKEIILIAQDTTKYGLDIYGKKEIARLLRELNKIEDIEWIRFLYSYPEDIDKELVVAVKECEKVCDYFDMPIQHISNNILKKMNRKTDKAHIESTVEMIRKHLPDATIRTTLITGFPGETAEDFGQLLDFVNTAEFDRLGVFSYSKEEGTPAAIMEDQIDENIKEERKNQIMQAQQKISFEKNQKILGKTLKVLVEEIEEEGIYTGRSCKDAPEIDGLVYIHTNISHNSGDFVNVKIKDAMEYDLIGDEIIEYS